MLLDQFVDRLIKRRPFVTEFLRFHRSRRSSYLRDYRGYDSGERECGLSAMADKDGLTLRSGYPEAEI